MKLFLIATLIIGSQFLTSCASKSSEDQLYKLPAIVVQSEDYKRISLYWEDTTERHDERKPWSDLVVKHFRDNLSIYNKSKDIEEFCPKYKSINDDLKIKAWGELIVGVVFYESGFKPTSRMMEKQLEGVKNPVDPITGLPVYSEGLFQLSYQDIQWAPYCQFDWSKDKTLPLSQRSIMQPLVNLDCGLNILKRQVQKKGAVTLSSDVYWAVLKINGKYTKIPEIKARVLKYAPECK